MPPANHRAYRQGILSVPRAIVSSNSLAGTQLMKSWAVWLGSITLVLVTMSGIGGLAFYKYSQLQAAMNMDPPPEQPTRVNAKPAQEITFRQSTTMIGTVLAPRSILLSNEIAGTVSAVHFEPGQIVEQDQILVELDTSVERAQLDAAKARRTIANSAYQRIREAANSRAVTASELDEAVAQLAQATAQVDELQAVIQRKTLRAPFRARVGLADTHAGQFLPSGFSITSLQSIDDFVYVDFMIPQSVSDSVDVGNSVELAAHSQSLTGEVLALDSQANRDSRNLMARAKVSSQLSALRPGDSVKVKIEYGDTFTGAAVEPEALRSDPSGTYVYVLEYVLDNDGEQQLRAFERTVEPGPTVNGLLTLRSGVEVGQLVVADGSFKLRERALVTLGLEETASPATPSEAATSEPGVSNTRPSQTTSETSTSDAHGQPQAVTHTAP
jgi:membrane fusion protein (multidrug efflux system)